MRVSRLFLDQSLEPQASGTEISVLDQARIHYAKNVLRLSPNDPIVVFNNQGGEFACQILSIEKKSMTLRVLEHLAENRALSIPLTIAICVTKRDAMDTAIQKVTELGAENIVPLISDRVSVSVKQIQTRRDHWQNVAISACEQCGLNRVPEVFKAKNFADWLKDTSGAKFFADVDGPKFHLPIPGNSQSLVLLVGPEGGLTSQEKTDATHNGFIAVNLGERVLRAETAAISLMTLANQSLSSNDLS